MSDICLELVDVLRYTREQGPAESSDAEDKSGILERNGLAWYARGSVLEVFNTNSSFKVISHNFHTCTSKSKPCTIECVEEVEALDCTLIAIGLRLGTEQSQIVFLTLRGCREIGRIDVQEDVKLLRFVDPNSCSIGLLSKYRGCLAAGTIDGKVILIDLCLKRSENAYGTDITMNGEGKRQCHIEFSRGEMKQLMQNHKMVKQRGMYFGLQLSHNEEASVECILDIVPLKVVCIGFADGTVLLWDLVDHSIMHRLAPPTEDCAVVTLNFVEPSDDPQACLYLWAFYAHAEGAFAFFHMIMCEEKYMQQGAFVYDRFQSCSSRLSLTSYDPGSVPLNIQTVTKKVSQEEEPITLSVLTWLGSNGTTTVMVFDLNQWYKAEMPYECDWQSELTHTVVFHLQETSFHARLNERTLVLFRSIQRPEEHFYPSSLAFDIINFNGLNRTTHRWVGLQNKLLQYLDLDGANCVINPAEVYGMLCRAALLPQFFEPISPSEGIVKEQREFVLSLGLEYNCHMFLQSCVDQWADGSHLGEDPAHGVSLSTLTDWIWNRSKSLKAVCNRMLASLMSDLACRQVDARTQNALSHCTRQMKQLADLYRTIMKDCLEFIPEDVQDKLAKESASISAAAEYQDILQWLLHIGILPEAIASDEDPDSESQKLVPYPYNRLAEFYHAMREKLDEEQDDMVPDTISTGKLLFVDNFLEREFDREILRKAWHEDGTNNRQALYPPQSLQKALRILLIPDVPLEPKLVVLLYLFRDIVAALEDAKHDGVVQQLEKFPRIFKMKIGVMKRVQAFWHLDHGNVTEAVEEFLSPMSSNIDFPQWHRELMVTVLLHLNAANLALKVLRAPGCPVSPQLELVTLIRNNLISEAFSLQRRNPQPDGRQLVWFVEAILKADQPDTLLEFALTDEEKYVLQEYLGETSFVVSDTLKLGHLLQNFEFVEAVQLVDRLSRKRNVDVEKEILGLYHNALDPMSQQLAYLTYHNPQELEPNIPAIVDGEEPIALETLSSTLIRNRADFRVRMLHRSIGAIKEAALMTGLQHDQPFLEKPGLGVFKTRPTVRSLDVCYPVRLDPTMNKRRQRERDISFEDLMAGRKASSPLLDEETGYGNPRKRRCLGPDHNQPEKGGRKFTNFTVPVPVIPEFRPMKPKFNFSSANADSVSRTSCSEKSASHSPSIFLTTPPLAGILQPHRRERKFPENNSTDSSPLDEHNDSYTPPGILKPTQSGQDSSPARNERLPTDSDEKVLRFDLPHGTTLDESTMMDDEARKDEERMEESASNVETPLIRRDLDLSGISNDDFYSPEVTMEPSSLQQVLASGGPAGRRSIHRSRSGTPVSKSSQQDGNNVAIIFEDPVEEDGSDKDMDVDETQPSTPENNVYVIDDSDGEQPNATEQENLEAIQDDVDEVVILDEEFPVPDHGEGNIEKVFMEPAAADAGIVVEPTLEHDEKNDEELLRSVMEEAYEEVVEDGASESVGSLRDENDDDYDDENEEIGDDEEEVAAADEQEDEDEDEDDESSVLEVIDLSDDEDEDERENEHHKDTRGSTPSGSSSTSGSSSSDGDEDKPAEGGIAGERPDVGRNAWQYGDLNVEPMPGDLFDGDDDVIQQVDLDDEEEDRIANSPEDAMGYIQVPTTSSSTHRTEAEGQVQSEPHSEATGEGEAQSSEVEDLSVPQQEAAETADSVAARDLSVAGGDPWPDSVASSSSGHSATTGPNAATGPAASPSAPQRESQPPAQEKVFGQPKNAHELEVPAMNLSVKPDEAHGSSRKNSKGEENGLTEDARALNLSAGQQELIERGLAADDENVSSNQGQQREDVEDAVQEAHSSDETRTEGNEMDIDLRVSDGDETDHHDESSSRTSKQGTPVVNPEDTESGDSVIAEVSEVGQDGKPEETEKEDSPAIAGTSKPISNIASEGESSTSTPRTNVKTRLMAAMEKSGSLAYTPTKRQTGRASSVAPESTNTPISPVLARSRRYTSMDNLAGTPDASQPLTPRRSTRASSLAKELFAGSTPQKRTRRASHASNDTEHPDSAANSPTDPVMEPPEPSERSFASSTASSTRRSMRIRKTQSQQPGTSGGESTAAPVVPLLSDYSSNRRLTRHQLAVLEKSMETVASSSGTRVPVSRSSRAGSKDVTDAAGDSESESVVSNVSNQSSLRSTRSKTNRSTTRSLRGGTKRTRSQQVTETVDDPQDDSDSDQSMAYVGSQRSALGLESIAEEGESNPTTSGKRRGRPPKSAK